MRDQQELSYRKQIARKLRTQYVEGIYDNPVTLKSRLKITQLFSRSYTIYGLFYWTLNIVTLKCGSEVTQGH